LREKVGMRGNITSRFYSPLPNPFGTTQGRPLQQERELGVVATHCFHGIKSCVDTYALWERAGEREFKEENISCMSLNRKKLLVFLATIVY
jgi:hypothetical protein